MRRLTLLFLAVLAIQISAAASLEARPLADTPTPTVRGVVEGRVVNATEGKPVSSITVTLHVLQGDVEIDRLASQADGQGRFRFAGLDSGPTMSYWAEAAYQGVGFSSGQPRPFAENQQTLSLPLDVFEATTGDADISLERVHYIVEYDPAHIYVAELYLFDNSGRRVYVGREGEDGRPETVRIVLPPGAENVASQAGGLDPRFKLTPGALIDTAPVLPGSASHVIFFGYVLPYQGDTFRLEREVPYAVENVNVLSEDSGPQLSGEQLTPLGVHQAQGQSYQNYTSTPLEKGAKLVVNIGGLSRVRAVPEEPSAPAVAVSQYTLRWLGVGLAVLALLATGAYPWLRQRPTGGETKRESSEVEARRRKLLQAIADLDDAHQAGELAESSYRSQREQRKAELVALASKTD
jgi:hypothetical protein